MLIWIAEYDAIEGTFIAATQGSIPTMEKNPSLKSRSKV